jgi:hypothetical protein
MLLGPNVSSSRNRFRLPALGTGPPDDDQHVDDQPVGLLPSIRHSTGRLESISLTTGVAVVTGGRPRNHTHKMMAFGRAAGASRSG